MEDLLRHILTTEQLDQACGVPGMQDEDRSSYERAEMLWRKTGKTRRRLLAALENSPILCAYGLVRSGCTLPKLYVNPADLRGRSVPASTLLSPKLLEEPEPADRQAPPQAVAGPAERAPPSIRQTAAAAPAAAAQQPEREAPLRPAVRALRGPPPRSFSPMRIENPSANSSPTRGEW